MADDRAGDSARVPNVNSSPDDSAPYKALLSAKNVSTASIPSRGIGGGGRLQVSERTPAEMGPREMTKFDPKNKYHVAMLQSAAEKDETTEGMLVHPGGSFSFPKKEQKSEAPRKKQRKENKKEAVAKPSHAGKDWEALQKAKREGKL